LTSQCCKHIKALFHVRVGRRERNNKGKWLIRPPPGECTLLTIAAVPGATTGATTGADSRKNAEALATTTIPHRSAIPISMDVRLCEERLALEGSALRALAVRSAPHCARSRLACAAAACLRTIDGHSILFAFLLLLRPIYLGKRTHRT